MKRSIVRKSLILTVVPTILSIHGVVESQEAVVTGPIVNVRRGPGTNYEVVARVKKDDRFPVINVKGSWVQIDIDEETLKELALQEAGEDPPPPPEETWIFRGLIQFVGKPPDFEERQIEFQNWALDEVPVTFIEFKSDSQIWVRLPPEKYASIGRVRQIARRIAQEYKRQTGYLEKKVVVKVLKGDRIYATASE